MPSATFVTNRGTFKAKLMPEHAPTTVANFTDLATGNREWKDPRDGQRKKDPLYNGTIFHRVIPNFMIQGGDPQGTGTGGPGYRFPDELAAARNRGYERGTLAMANAGPDTNGSQFFVCLANVGLPPAYSVFGEVTQGMDVVDRIAALPLHGETPVETVFVEKVTLG